MNSDRTANLAIALVILGWVFCAYAALSNLGDPAPWVAQEELNSWHRRSVAIAFFGVIAISFSLFLAGRSFSVSKVRSSIALAAFIIPFALIFFGALWQP